MADTSLVFNIIARDSGVGRALSAVQRAFRGAGNEAEASLGQAASSTANLDRMIDEATTRVRSLSEEFERTGDKKLFGQIGRDRTLISNLERVRSNLRDTSSSSDDTGSSIMSMGQKFMGAVGAVQGFGSSISNAVGSVQGALGPYVQLGITVGMVSAAMFAAPAAFYAVGAAAASIPAMLSGAIAALFTLKMGMSGLSENWAAMNKPATGGGGGGGGSTPKVDMTPKIRAVEAAQRGVARSAREVTDAQEDLTEATKALNDAREDEQERIEDVRRSLASAKADEADSVQSLAEARMALATAEQRGNPDEIRRAQIAVDKQAASLEEAKDKTQDLQKESDEAAQKGVEGSDAVVAAKKRERDAQRAVQDAVANHKLALQQLGDAQKSLNEKIAAAGAAAGGGLGVQLPKIAKSAQAFLDELKRLKPAFDALRLDIQERLFAGLADKLRIAAERWLPALHDGLGKMADMMNGVVKTAFDSISEPEFIKNTMIGVDAVTKALGNIGQAIAGPLVDAWGRLSAASAPFIEMLGEKIAGLIERFAEWIKQADESGALTAFFEKATSIVGSLFDIFGNLASIAGSVISILFGTSGGSTDAWENLAKASEKVAKWMADPAVQAKISKYLDMFGGAIFGIGRLAANLDDIWHAGERMVAWVQGAYNTVKTWLDELPTTIGNFFTNIGTWFSELPGRIWGWLSGLPNQLWSIFSTAMTNAAYLVGWGIGAIGRALVALPGQVWNWLKNLPTNVGRILRSVGDWFGQVGTWAWNGMKNVATNAGNALSNLPSTMWNAGYNAVIGIWNGITSMSSWLWSKVQNLGIDMWNAFMRGIGAASPSKKFAEGGKWAVLGAGVGIDNNRKGLLDKVFRLADDVAAVPFRLDSAAMDGQLTAAANTTMTAAVRRRQDVVVTLDVTGTNKEMKTLVQKMARVNNLYQTA